MVYYDPEKYLGSIIFLYNPTNQGYFSLLIWKFPPPWNE